MVCVVCVKWECLWRECVGVCEGGSVCGGSVSVRPDGGCGWVLITSVGEKLARNRSAGAATSCLDLPTNHTQTVGMLLCYQQTTHKL